MWSFARRSYLNSASLLRSIVLVVVFCSMVSLKPCGGPKLFVVPFCANETSWVQTTRANQPCARESKVYGRGDDTFLHSQEKQPKRPPTRRLSLLSPMETKCSLVVDFSFNADKRISKANNFTGGVSSTPTVSTINLHNKCYLHAQF